MRGLFIVFLVMLIMFIIYLVHKYNKSRRKRKIRNLSESGWNSEIADAVDELINDAENGNDHLLAARTLRFNRVENDPHVAPEITNNIFNQYTAALQEMTLDEAPFIIDQADLLDQDLLWNIATEPARIFHQTLQVRRPQQQQSLQQTVQTAKKTSKSHKEASAKVFDQMKQMRSDSQNVHDPKLNNDLRATLRKLRSTYTGVTSCISSARKYLKGHKFEANCLKALEEIEKNNTISTYDDTELNIFCYVWDRCFLSQNKENREGMLEAVCAALNNCVENGNLVCINGRCSQLLSSLVLLDYDSSVGAAMTYDAYKNQIYKETKDLLEDELLKFKNSNDAKFKSFYASYISGGECDPDIEQEFKKSVKRRTDHNLEAYIGKLTELEIEKLKSDCYIYIDI